MFRPFPFLAAAVLTVSVPLSALADKPAHAGKNGNGHAKVERKIKHKAHKAHKSVSPRQAAEREVRRGGVIPVVVGDTPVVVAPRRIVQNCPPGLAKKDPPCVPPGQAKKGRGVGNVVDWDHVHIVTRPGLYGLSEPPNGQRYAIVDGRLVRVDSQTSKILSIIRLVDAILD